MKVHISFIAGYMSCCCLLTHHGVTSTRNKRQISFRERRPDEFTYGTYTSMYREPLYSRPHTFDYWRKASFPRGDRPSWSSSSGQSSRSRDSSSLASGETSGFRFEDDDDNARESAYPLRTEGRSTSSREDNFSQPTLFDDNPGERAHLFTNENSKSYFDSSQRINHSNRQSKVSPVFDTVEPVVGDLVDHKQGSFRDYPDPYNEDARGRHLSPDTIAAISETLGAINTLGRYLVNYTRGSNPSTSGDRLDTPALTGNTREEDLPGAIYTISKNVLGRNVTDTIAPLVRVLPIGKVTHDSSLPPCTTPSGQAGYCDDLSNCPQLLLNLGNLRQSICFKSLFVPGVCCPKKTTEQSALSVTQQPLSTTTRRPIILTTKYPTNNVGLISSPITPVPGNSINYDEKDCGKPEVPKFRVVGGDEALPGRWPWMAAIFLHGNRRTEFWCGGSLIGSRHVLTAAHCTKDSRQRPFSVHQFTVRLGDVDLRRDDEPSAPQTYKVVDVRAHPRFSRVGFYNDIAVLVLERPARRSRYVIPVCLPPRALRNEMFVGESPTVVGWGTTYYGGKESTVQRQAALPVWKNEDCDRTYFQPITENFICAGLKEGGKDACQGDSGGPLMIKKEGHWMQIGIVSFGNKCGEPGYPGVYTRITEYLDWISENTVT